jgi:hypothetical protein
MQETENREYTRINLTQDLEQKIIGKVKALFASSDEARKKYRDDWEDCRRAYLGELDPAMKNHETWRSKLYFPWANNAVKTVHAYLSAALIPKDSSIFALKGRTPEDDEPLEPLEQYLSYMLETKSDLKQKLRQAIRLMLCENHVAVKTQWLNRQSEKVDVDLSTGKRYVVPVEEFNAVAFDILTVDTVAVFPANPAEANRNIGHLSCRNLEDIISSAKAAPNAYLTENIKRLKDELAQEAKSGPLSIKEVYFKRLQIEDEVYYNHLATVVHDKVLIRLQPLPASYQSCPVTVVAYEPDSNSIWGYGLLSRALPLLKAANLKENAKLDSLKVLQYPQYKYFDDGVFDAYAHVARPGAFHEFADATSVQSNMIPVTSDPSGIQLSSEEILFLKTEFEDATVSRVIKGLVEQGQTTATEVNLTHHNSANELSILAQYINDSLVKPMLKQACDLLLWKLKTDPRVVQDFERVTGKPLMAIPEADIDIQIIGYDNWVQRQAALSSLNALVQAVAVTPAAKYLKWDEILDASVKAAELDVTRLVMGKEEKAQADQQEAMQQQAAMQASQAQTEAAMQQQKAVYDIQVNQLELEKIKEQNRFETEQLKQQYTLTIEQMKEEGRIETAILNAQLKAAELEERYQVELPDQKQAYAEIDDQIDKEGNDDA